MSRIEELKKRIEPSRQQLLEHGIYPAIDSVQDLRVFMEGHVYAVWDFMSLLKALQDQFSPVRAPWVPPKNLLAARLINEIVLGEETDENQDGSPVSHFQLYLGAMEECDADLTAIQAFVASIGRGSSVDDALASSTTNEYACQFVRQTFSVIDGGDGCELAAAFTFGREDLLPDVFQRIVDELNTETHGQLSAFLYYLDRHIELDGDQHGPMAEQLIASLCGEDPQRWERATAAAKVRGLGARLCAAGDRSLASFNFCKKSDLEIPWAPC